MRVQGVVSRVDGECAWVVVSVSGGCGRCHEEGGCGGVNIAKPFGQHRRELRVPNDIDARAGEAVNVVIDDAVPLRAALLTYGLPILGVLVGAWLGTALAGDGRADLSAALGAGAGGVVMFFFGRARASFDGAMPVRLERPEGLAAEGCRR